MRVEKCAPGKPEKCEPLVGKGRPAHPPDWNCNKMRTHIHSPRNGERGNAQEVVWLFTGCIVDVLQDGGLEMWIPANAHQLASWHLPARPFCCLVINPRIMSIALILKISVYSVNAPAYILPPGKNPPLHLALQPPNIILQNWPGTQMGVNETQILSKRAHLFIQNKRCSRYIAIQMSDRGSFDLMANVSNAESANNVRHLGNNNSSSEHFPQILSRSRRATCSRLQICRQIAVPFDLLSSQGLWQILRGTNALCFQLLTLIPAHWLWIGSIVPPFQTIFQSSPYLFDQFAENLSTKCLSFKKDYKLLDYDQSPLFDLIKSFLHSRSLIAYGLGAHSKNHFYLENCPAFNGSPVTGGPGSQKDNLQDSHWFLFTASGWSHK